MPDSDPRDGFFYLPLKPMIDPYIILSIGTDRQNVASDQCRLILSLIQQIVDTVTGSKIDYHKCPEILNTQFHTSFAQILLFMQLFLKY